MDLRLRNDLYCVVWGVKLYSLTHLSMGEGDFRPPPHSSETPGPIFMKLEIYNYFPDATQHAKCQGPMSTWVVWANSQFDAWKFLSFFSFLSHDHRSLFWTHPKLNTSLCVVPAKEVPFGGLNLKFDPLYPLKNVKIGTKLAFNWKLYSS